MVYFLSCSTLSTLTCTVKLSHGYSLIRVSKQALKENRFVVGLRYGRWQYATFSCLLLDLLPVSQTSYKQVSKQLAKFMLNGENMDNITVLYTPNLSFTFGTYSMHAFFWVNM